MKKYLLFLFFVYSNYSYSQDTIYFDAKWKSCQFREASYYRITKARDSLFLIEDHYINGQLQMKGVSSNKYDLIRQNQFLYYNREGVCTQMITYQNNEKNGDYILYYSNGTIKEKGNYEHNLLNGLNVQYFENGKQRRIANFKKGIYDGEMIYYNKQGIKIGEGLTKNNHWFGEWKKYNDKGVFLSSLYYDDNFTIKECGLIINTCHYVWQYSEQTDSLGKQIVCKVIGNKDNPKSIIQGPPEITFFVPVENMSNASIEKVKGITSNNKDRLIPFDKRIKLIDMKFDITDSYFTIFLLKLLVNHQLIDATIKMPRERNAENEPVIKEFINYLTKG